MPRSSTVFVFLSPVNNSDSILSLLPKLPTGMLLLSLLLGGNNAFLGASRSMELATHERVNTTIAVVFFLYFYLAESIRVQRQRKRNFHHVLNRYKNKDQGKKMILFAHLLPKLYSTNN